MRRFENECVGCPTGMGCLGCACPNRSVLVLECDECHSEEDNLYSWNDKEICFECLKAECLALSVGMPEPAECDECGETDIELFFDGEEWLCEECLRQKYEIEFCDDPDAWEDYD